MCPTCTAACVWFHWNLEDVGLTHISGPQKLRRNLLGALRSGTPGRLASVIEPVSFHERYQGQKTDSLTALDRLVDAVVADPPARQADRAEVAALSNSSDPEYRAGAEVALRRRFTQWEQAAPNLEAWAHRSVRLSDIEARARQLAALGQIGLEALAYIDAHAQPAAEWQDSRMAMIQDAEKPSGLVRFVFLPDLRKLVQLAAQNRPSE